MNKYVGKIFGIMFKRQKTQQVVRASLQYLPVSPEEWHAYWQAKGFPWRTEREIDEMRQEELRKCRAVTSDIEKGNYPFKGLELGRADVEWLLATHENGRGPVDWSDEWQRKRKGLDLRGADLRGADLQHLPLAGLIGGLSLEEDMHSLLSKHGDEGLIHLEKVKLGNAHLEGAKLGHAYLEAADLYEAHLQYTDLTSARLQYAWLDKAHLEHANLSYAHLIATNLDDAHLEEANLSSAHAEGANLDRAHLEKANLTYIHLEKASLRGTFLNNAILEGADLAGTNLHSAHLEGTDLRDAHFEGKHMETNDLKQARKWFNGQRWRGMEDVLISPEEWEELQEEFPEELLPADLSGTFFDSATLLEKAHLGDNKYGLVSLVDVSWGGANLSVVDWANVKVLGDKSIALQRKMSINKRERLSAYQQAVRANRQLAVALLNQGLNEDAARFSYVAQVLQRKVFWFQILQPRQSFRQRCLSFGAWLFSGFLSLLAGYGYKLLRSFRAYVLIISIFTIIYLCLSPHLAWYEAIVVSMTAFHGRGFSPSTFSPGDPLSIASAFEAFVGLIIEVTFIATLTQRFFGK
jgi:uncharacterized protein YjbI with pentapeptide repeats